MQTLEDLLEKQPRARERKYKNEAIAYLLKLKHSLNLDRKLLMEIVKEANTLDREWRKLLEENPKLRGSDYEEKNKLVDKKLKELGYKN